MKLLLVCLSLIFVAHSGSCVFSKVDTFEFGNNYGNIGFSTSGSMGLFEKVKRVSVTIPECTELKYVRVDINHHFRPPSVKFNWDTRTVIIQFSPLQYSVSEYTVTGKVIDDPFCGNGAPPSQYVPIFPLSVD